MGLESISPQNLRNSRKGFNAPADYARIVRATTAPIAKDKD